MTKHLKFDKSWVELGAVWTRPSLALSVVLLVSVAATAQQKTWCNGVACCVSLATAPQHESAGVPSIQHPVARLAMEGLAALQGSGQQPRSQPDNPPQAKTPPLPPRTSQPQSAGPEKPQPESKITAQQAEELFRSVDEILNFASRESHLPIKQPVKRELANRDTVRAYITKHLQEDKDAQRLERSEASLKKFGLVPVDFDLRRFMLEVLEDQVAGYYDAKTKTVYLLDWVTPEAQRPVLAHELTHALQDQSFDLEHWLKVTPNRGTPPKTDLDDTKYDPEEAQAAREAVSEGQAMAVLVDYILEPSGKSLVDAPTMAEVFKESTRQNAEQSPVLARAPLYLKESLMFSYTWGLGFVQELLAKGGRDLAFAGALKNPPHDTREIMQPKSYLADQHVAPIYLPRLGSILNGNYEKYDVGEVGEFDVYVLMEQGTSTDLAESLAPSWRGGTYLLARRLTPGQASPATQLPLRDLALIYVSHWVSNEAANHFAASYASWLPNKYKSVKPADTRAGGVMTVETDKFLTEDGAVYVEPHGDMVLVMEGFDDASAAKLRNLVLARDRVGIFPNEVVEPEAMVSISSRLREAASSMVWVH